MNKPFRYFSAAGLFLIAAALAGCGSSKNETGAEKPAEPEKPKEPVTLTFFNAQAGSIDFASFFESESFKSKFPHITVQVINRGNGSNYPDLIASGQLPDIIYESTAFTVERVMANGFHYDMTDLIKKHGFDLNIFEPNVLAHARNQTTEGKLYGLPVSMNKYATFYNKDLFDRFGVPYPKDGMTWDDIYDLSKRLTRSDGGEVYQGITFVVNNMMLNNQLSAGPLHPKEDRANLNADEWKLLFENFGRFFQIPNASILPVGDFPKGKVAMIVNAHPSIVGYAKENPALNWDVVSVPVLKEKPNTGFKPASLSLFVTQTSKHKDDAFLTVAYLVSEEVQTLIAANGSATPLASKAVQQSTGKNIPEWQGKNVNALYYYQDAPPTPPRDASLTNVGVSYEKWFREMIQNQIDVNTALRSFEEEINQAIAAEKAKTGK